jgi:hypothetical protein
MMISCKSGSTVMERMDFYTHPEPNSGCHLWIGAVKDTGYGKLCFGGKTHSAPRLAWELTKGKIPKGLWVLHRCDTPACVNPDHLFLGTHVDNMEDMKIKGRQPKNRGMESSHPKLSNNQVLAIRKSIGSQRTIAKQFNIHPTMVHLIKTGKRWGHLQ